MLCLIKTIGSILLLRKVCNGYLSNYSMSGDNWLQYSKIKVHCLLSALKLTSYFFIMHNNSIMYLVFSRGIGWPSNRTHFQYEEVSYWNFLVESWMYWKNIVDSQTGRFRAVPEVHAVIRREVKGNRSGRSANICSFSNWLTLILHHKKTCNIALKPVPCTQIFVP